MGEVRRSPRGRGNRKPGAPLFAQLLTAAVDTAGDAIAVSYSPLDGDRRELTYAELDEYSTRLARELLARGIGPGDVVALGSTRSIESVAAVWAVAKTGAAYVPVDPALPAERIAYLLSDSGAALGLTCSAHRSALGASIAWLELDSDADRIAAHPAHPLSYLDRVRPLTDQHPAYVIYTSGSTGRPKGVVVTHTGLAGLVAAARERYSVDASARVLHVCSPNFDVSVLELLVAFTAGATLIVSPPQVYAGRELAELIARERVTHLLITPAALESVDPHGLDALRVVVVAGDAFGPTLVRRWAPGRAFFNGYGPTEATVLATGSTALNPGEPVTIGSAFPGIGAVVLDARLRPVPVGVAGELYLSGPALAQSYQGRPGLTAERFVAAPFAGAGARMYRTGDLVRRTDTGDFEYLGRSDFQVKIRGFRVELGEIDAALTAHPDLDYAVTVGAKAGSGATALVSYVLPRPGLSVDTEEVIRFVGTSLPGHMVPTLVLVLDEIPLTPNGKLDRNALPTPVFAAVTSRAPEGSVETAIAELFAQVLGVERVGAEDSFFAAGGDSILSIQLVTRARNAGISFTPQQVFEHRTVAGLARVAALGADTVPTLAELPGGGVGEVALTPVLAATLTGGRVFGRFTQQMVLALPEGIDRADLVRVLTAVVDHHDMLRAGVRAVEEQCSLDVLPPGGVEVDGLLRRFDGSGDIAALAMDAVLETLDPPSHRMIGFGWLTRDDGPDGLIVAANHLVIDGVSWRILLSDLVTAWAQHAAGQPITLPPVGTSFRRWAHGLVESAPSRRAELDHWRRILAVPDPLLGRRALDPVADTASTVRTFSVEIPADVTRAVLTDLPARYRAGAEDGLLAALALAVRSWRARRGIDASATRVRLEGHGREESAVDGADLTRTVGWFTSMYPVVLDVGGVDADGAWQPGAQTAAVVKAIKEQLRAVPDRGIGFGMLRHLDPESELTGPLGQIGFNYLGRISTGDVTDHSWLPTSDWGEPHAEQDPELPAAAVVDINAVAVATEDGALLRASFSYASLILDESAVRELADCWTSALIVLAEHLDHPAAGGLSPSDVPLVSVSQAELDDWHRSYPGLGEVVSLAPLQLGLLFLAQVSPTDPYLVQLAVEMTGAVDLERLRRAAESVLGRHDILRTAFATTGTGIPVGLVVADVAVPWRVVDTDLTDPHALLAAESRIRFDLATAPLLRFTVYRRPESLHLVVTAHHLLVDGWSMPLLMRELLVCYAADGVSTLLPHVRPYRDYLAWLADQDRGAAREAWRVALAGHEPSLLAATVAPSGAASGHGMAVVELSPEQARELAGFAAATEVTLNTVFQVAWGVVLAGALGRDDVLFGAVVSGRPPQLDGVDGMVGLFANTVPVRVRVSDAASLRELLSRVQSEQIALLDGHHLGLTEIQRVAGAGELFDTLMAYESYPVDSAGIQQAQGSLDGLEILDVRAANATHYPIAVGVEVGVGIRVGLQYQLEAIGAPIAEALAGRLRTVLDVIVSAPERGTADLLETLARERDALSDSVYWRAVLADLPLESALPMDRPRRAPASAVLLGSGSTHEVRAKPGPAGSVVEGERPGRVDFIVPAEVFRRVRETAHTYDTTAFSVVHAVFATLLSRLSGTDDIVIAVPDSPAAHRVLRLRVLGALSFERLLTEASVAIDHAVARPGITPEEMVALHAVSAPPQQCPSRDLAGEHSASVQDRSRAAAHPLVRVALASTTLGDTASFDLALSVDTARLDGDHEPTDISAHFAYDTALFDAQTIETFARRWVRVLSAATEDPTTPVGDLTILSTAEQAALFTRPTETTTSLFPDLVARGAVLGADRVAVRHDGHSTTYGELTEHTARLARELIAHGVGPEVAVAVAVPRSFEMVAAAVAITTAGGVFVPMDPANPAQRLDHLVTDSGAALGITLAAHLDQLPTGITWLVLDDPDVVESCAARSGAPVTDHDRRSPLRVDHPAYIIYTSGSTGLPKGVTVTHAGLGPLVAEAVERYGLESNHRFLHVCSPWFDPSVLEWLCAFSTGATLVVVSSDILGGVELAELLATEAVTHAIITPAVLGTLDPTGLDTLVCLSVGGDVTTPELLAKWQGPHRRYLNGYGPTETTIISTYAELVAGQPITIGAPVRGTRAVILDARLNPVAPGVTGELYLSGPALARGYRDQPVTTSARFVADPWGAPGTRLYRTGDRVRLRANGDLDYVGRADAQLKVRGFRIEPGEIDAVLTGHADVECAVTVGRRTATGSISLISYVLAASGSTPVPTNLIDYAAHHLPAHAVPSAVVVLDAWPLTSNGKLDRDALPDPVAVTETAQTPVGAMQTRLAELFARVLGVPSVGVDDSFFAIGGDSILSIQLVSLARASGITFSTRDVFEHRTVAALARVATTDGPATITLAELPGGGVGEVPPTPVLADFLTTGSSDRFAQTMVLALPDGIDRAGLLATLGAVVAHHDMLRARLRDLDGRWRLEVLEPHAVPVEELIGEIDAGQDRTGVGALAMEAALATLNPAAARMIAFTWVRGAGGGDVLVVAAHHYVIDGVSWRILLPDLILAWAQHSAGQPITLPPVGTSFRRWAHALTTVDRTAELPHWQQALATTDPLLGARALDPTVDTEATTRSITVRIPSEVTDPLLTTLPALYRAGADHGLLVALALAVRVWRARRGVDAPALRLRLEGHGRQEEVVPGADLTRTIGWFTTVYPVVLDLSALRPTSFDDEALAATMRAVKEQLLAVPDNGIGFGLLRRAGDLPTEPVAQIGFNYLGRAVTTGPADGDWLPTDDLGDIAVEHDPALPANAVLDINTLAVATDTGPCLQADFRYATGILAESEVRELADIWSEWLSALADHTRHPRAGGLTPSDAPLVRVSQTELDTWRRDRPGLSEVLPLSPLQHSLFALGDMLEESVHAYVIQLMVDLTGDLDVDRLRHAAGAVLTRHANLRSAFVTTADGTPVQVIADSIEAPVRVLDTTESELAALLAADQAAGFDPAVAPLLRFTVYRTGSGRNRLVLTGHHILLDGWSMPLLMKELLVLYTTGGDASVLPEVRPYRDYLDWLTRQDRAAAEQAWSRLLHGVEPTMLAPELTWPRPTATGYGLCEFDLDVTATAALTTFAAAAEVTANTVFQTAWALVLAASTGRADIVFGATVSGRPPQLDGVGDMIGLFVDAVPVRVRVDGTVEQVIRAVQTEQAALLDHHHLGLGAIQRLADRGELFDTMLAFESYPVDVEGLRQAGGALDGLRVDDLHGADHTHYPITVLVFLGACTQVQVKYRRDLVSDAVAGAVTDRLRTALSELTTTRTRATQADPARSARATDIVTMIGADPIDPITRSRFWRTTLADLPARLALPTETMVGDLHPARTLAVPAATHRELRRLTASTRVGWSSTIGAAVSILIARLTTSTDITLGTSELLSRTRIDPDETFLALLDRVDRAAAEADTHAGIPVHDLAQLLGTEPGSLGQFRLELRDAARPDHDSTVPSADLTVVVTESGTGMSVGIDGTGLDSAASTLFAHRLIELLTDITRRPTTPVGDLSVTVPGEIQLLDRIGTGPRHRSARTLAQLLVRGTGFGQRRIAVRDNGTDYTYGTLDAESSRLARVLIDEGVGPETVVACAIPRSYDAVLALWAVAKAGGVYLPVDPNYPDDRIRHMLADSGARVGLTVTAHAGVLAASVRSLVVDDPAVRARVAARASTPVRDRHRRRPLRRDNTAYLIYTSGSTGTPKAVCVTHTGLAALVAHSANLMRLRHDDRMLHVCSPSFDQSIEELTTAFHRGATLVIAPPQVLGGAELDELLRTERVTHTIITPALLSTLDPTGLPDLRCVSAGGEAVAPELVTAWAPGRTFLNGYGPTEATIGATYTVLRAGERITIGTPVPGMRAVVLDTRLRPVPVGVTGELYLTGPALARGYGGRAATTAERFVACPWSDTGARMYRTGDLVRWVHKDSYELEYLGRGDFQIKIRGFRIEPGEVDAVLLRHPQVSSALTLGAENPAGQTVLVSYVTGRAPDPGALTRWAATLLPAHMVPAAVVVLDRVPVSATGKIDRTALPAPEFVGRPYREPAAGTERTVAGVFADVLGVERVGADDNFFDLGGNSLLATRLAARLSAAVGTRVPVRALFAAPTVAGCAAAITASAQRRARPALVAGPRPPRVPLSPAQQRMWFLNRFDTGTAAYTIPVVLRLTGVLDTAALIDAFADLVARHEILRTVYPVLGQAPAQVVLPIDHPDVPRLVLAPATHDPDAAVAELISAPFEVTTEVPLRAALFATGEEHILAVAVHHIAGDGFSGGPLTRDLVSAYTARVAGHAPDWAPLSVQYADYAIWQQNLLGDETDPASTAATQLAYWQRELADLPDQLELPRDRPRPAVQTYAGGRVPFTLDAATHTALTELARTHGATLFMAVHTALAVVLSRLSGSTDIAIGTPVAGRGDAVLDDLIGMFVNTLVFRTRVEHRASFTDQLTHQRDIDLQAFAHADIPFERLVEVLNPARSTARHPLFQVGLSFQNLGQVHLDLPGIAVTSVELDRALSQFDLHLIVADRYRDDGAPAGISGYCTYATDLFDAATVAGFLDRLTRLLSAVLTDPTAPLHTIDLLDSAERARIIDAGNRPVRHGDPAATLASLRDATVRSTPGAIALVADGARWTFADLDARVNRLARYLVAAGVGPHTRVALAMRRSVDLVVAMYAVTAAGGAYVPVDPDQPHARTRYILDTATPLLTLTDTGTPVAAAGSDDVVVVAALDLAGYSPEPLIDAERVAPLRAAHTAYVIFTSGSTGRPKGVAVSHAAIVNQLRWKTAEFGLGADDAVLLKTAATFDLSVWEFWSTAVSGGRIVLASPDGHRDPAYLAGLMRTENVTTLHAVPSMLDALLTEDMPASLRRVLAIGEALPVALARRIAAAAPQVALFNVYGPTEAAVSITSHRVTADDTATVPIGRPVHNSRVYVLDAHLNPVPVGVAGELYLAGTQLATGYFARPDLTADRFVADPFTPGERMYRTGDLASWTADGELEYRGRTDFQTKIRGFRIELTEIDTVLTEHPDVSSAVTLGHVTRTGETVLVSYVVPAQGKSIVVERLGEWAANQFPAHMVPAAILVLDRIPLTAHGKLDRDALPAPTFTARAHRAPVGAVEQAVCAVYADVLRLDRVGMDEHFFELGGTSLLATRLATQLSEALAAAVPVTWIFTAPTPAGILTALRAAGTDSTGSDTAFDILLPLRTGGQGEPLFCVHPVSGLAWSFSGLTAHLDRPVYGLQSPALSSADPLPDSIEQWALLYLKHLRAVQPEGPYHLLGWSLGGVIAHAMAVQLQEDGEQVALLGMLDSRLTSASPATATDVTAADLLGGFAGAGDELDARALAHRLCAISAPDLPVDEARVDRIIDGAATSITLDAAYRPRTFDGTLTYFTATDDPTGSTGAASWTDAVTAIDNHPIPATHWHMTDPDALTEIARILRSGGQ
ncbi:amino acid adenylation domain-containing protein [Nocardia caishijiensis]|uniref:Non-ribosomal peptide synthase protein (TIGR01720 family)/amino acid adenylation domain-containing protein n=1 Tax=Nocardia caishijiensis TaxID=184756 RepID=A0ABQ6YMF7_9NOCA|nr:non-ribosomal peptide synthetase [Nocardia caishijiensis]KAF0846967.1 non-ribosomal peptide synthase protein (TIGR01720 family)/amino acid adenylation domain-containing protein [Nocardia caishijiensis]